MQSRYGLDSSNKAVIYNEMQQYKTLFAMLRIVYERLPSAEVYKEYFRNTIDRSINLLGPDQA